MRKFLLAISAMFLLLMNSMAQTRQISGKVTDESGAGVANASVVVQGTTIGTATNAQGEFTLSVPATAKFLEISALNMTPKTVAVADYVNVSLDIDPEALGAVVVTVPYGTVKKTAFTGAENTVTNANIQKQQHTSVTRTLEGMVPGLQATNGGGAPGTGATVVIRGFGSINAASTPLYVLNGVPYDGSIAAIANEDIESVTVLKDAAAAALYGSRAANGVIMITTKKGRGKATVNASVRKGFMTRGISEYDRVSIPQYYELNWEAMRNQYIAQGVDPTQAGINASNELTGVNGLVYNAYNVPGDQLIDPTTGKINPNAQLLWNDSWEDALFRQAGRLNANVNVSGSSDGSDYYLSAGYLKEEGIMRFSDYERYNLRLDVNTRATKWFKTGVNIDAAVANTNGVLSSGTATSNPFYYTRNMGPIYPVYQRDLTTGALVIDPLTGQPTLDWGLATQMGVRPYAPNSNNLGSLEMDERTSQVLNGNANIYGEITFLKNFTFKSTLGVNLWHNNTTTYQNNLYGDGQAVEGRSTKGHTKQLSLTGNQVLSWAKSFGKHNVRALAGHENYKYKVLGISAEKTGFSYLGQTELNNGTLISSPPSSYEDNLRIESYFTNVNYDYNDRYLFSASWRTDGSSRFAPDVRWGNFYSVGAGWRISQEEFMDVKWLNELKLRASYGEQGNEDIGLFYQYRDYYYADGVGGYSAPTRPANANLEWEKNATFNVGFDFGIFKRLTGSIDYFKRTSSNLLFDVPLPTSSGYASVFQNIGTMYNKGIELQLGYNAIMTRNFNWRVDLNLSHIVNKITELPPSQAKNGIVSGTKKLMEGHGIYDFWLREYAGVDASNGDALYYMDVKDADGNVIGRTVTNNWASATEYFHGSAIPDFSGGLTNSFNYKGFDLSVLLTFAYGGLFYDGSYATLMHRGDYGSHMHSDVLDRWQKPGDITNVPRLENNVAGQSGSSTRWLFDGSYLNIKNITLSYQLPEDLVNKLKVGGLQVFANIDNVHLFSAKKGMDPQRSFTGTSDFSYVPYRTFSFGFNVKLK